MNGDRIEKAGNSHNSYSESLELPTREERVLPYLNTNSCFLFLHIIRTAHSLGPGQLHGAKERQQVNNVVS